MFHYSWVSFAQ